VIYFVTSELVSPSEFDEAIKGNVLSVQHRAEAKKRREKKINKKIFTCEPIQKDFLHKAQQLQNSELCI